MKHLTTAAFTLLLLTRPAFGQAPGSRPLTLEDYYRVKTIGDIQISPDGKRAAYTVSTRNEDDNTTQVQTFVVPTDGASAGRLIQHAGKDIASPRWTDDNLLSYTENARTNSAVFIGGPREERRPEAKRWKADIDSPNVAPMPVPSPLPGVTNAAGWRAEAREEKPSAKAEAQGNDFEKRHASRFKGKAFDWMRFQQDGQDLYVLSRYPIDASKVATMGHSYGGFMTNWLITQYPDRFAAAAAGAGISNWFSDYGTADIYRTKETEFFGAPWEERAIPTMVAQSPLMQAGKVKTPTLFIHGEQDQRVPYEEGEQMYFALRRRGVPAKMIQYAGQPHGISGHWNNVHRMLNELAWFETYVNKGR